MKTLLSLTSRKSLVRVIFQKDAPRESMIAVDARSGVVNRTKEALGRFSREIIVVLGIGIAQSSGAQELPKIPETPSVQVAKLSLPTLISILESSNPPKTVEAAEFLINLDENMRNMILTGKFPKESVYMKGYEDMNTLPTSENKLTLLPPLSTVKHIQRGNALAGELQEYLKDPNINANNIGDISDVILEKMGEDNPELFDQVLAYNEEGKQVSSELLAYTLEMERITTARADRSEILYKKSVAEKVAVNAEKVAVNAEKVAVNAEKVAVNAEKVAVNAELVKARGALEGATKLLAALQGLKI